MANDRGMKKVEHDNKVMNGRNAAEAIKALVNEKGAEPRVYECYTKVS